MKFHTGKHPFKGKAPHAYTAPDESHLLTKQVQQHNEAHAGKGLKFLRSFLSNVVRLPEWAAAKPIYAAINAGDVGGAVAHAKALLAQEYSSAEEHFRHAQIGCFVKKYPFSGDVDKRRENALRKFNRGERRNRHMNALLRARRRADDSFDSGLYMHPSNRVAGQDRKPFVKDMRQYIARVLGSKPSMSEIIEGCRWGPGSVVGVNGQFTHFARKLLAEEWTVTPAALPYVLTVAKRFPMFWELLGLRRTYPENPERGLDSLEVICIDNDAFDTLFTARCKLVQYNKIAFVPKDADCDRTIASEPLLNQFLQLGIDYAMKVRLKRHKIDLRSQARNQELARQGSILGWFNSYCTADLKNASGSIYIELVRELFPPSWFTMLNDLRSPSFMLDTGEVTRYTGFASMGNGFCFPVETLIFASICSAAHRYTGTAEDFAVYGDDIIMRQNESGVVQEYLRYFGFELNPDKSFFFGPFRESCGADWYDGKQVRPVYLDDTLDTFEQRVRAHNAFARLAEWHGWAGPLAVSCQDWFPKFSSKFARPHKGHDDEAVDNRWQTISEPFHMRNKTLQCASWYGLRFTSKSDREIALHPAFGVAYRYGVLSGGDAQRPFAMRRETRMAVARFSHGGGNSQEFHFEKYPCEGNTRRLGIPVKDFIGPRLPYLTPGVTKRWLEARAT